MSSAVAGWYVDPSTGTNLRYWSGSTWTDEVAPLPHEPMRSGPFDLFGASTSAAETATPTAEEPATTTAAESSLDLVGSEPEHVEAVPDPVETEPEHTETEPEQVEEPAELVAVQAEAAPEPTEVAAGPRQMVASAEAATESAPEPAVDDPVVALPTPELEPEVERTQLTRRELRARRGADPAPDDTPKHLPSMTPPIAAPVCVAPDCMVLEPLEEVKIPAQEAVAPLEVVTADNPVARRRRIVRMSVLLGILGVTSSVAVLTAGTL